MRHSENNTNFSVRYCNSCEHPWENIHGKLMIYSEFPTYGLQRKTCSKCVKKQQRMEDFSYAEVYSNPL